MIDAPMRCGGAREVNSESARLSWGPPRSDPHRQHMHNGFMSRLALGEPSASPGQLVAHTSRRPDPDPSHTPFVSAQASPLFLGGMGAGPSSA